MKRTNQSAAFGEKEELAMKRTNKSTAFDMTRLIREIT